MFLKCVAIDDEPLALKLISAYISRIPEVKLINTFEDAISGAEYINHTPVDLVFLDINMPDISGVDLARALKKKPMIIFTTAHKQFAFDGFELDAVDYLLKPIDFERFSKAIYKALDIKRYKSDIVSAEEDAFIYVHSEYRMIKIILKQIEYIESMEDYVKIHIHNEKPILSLMTLKKILEMLPDPQFKRIHRSYIIPVSKVRSVQNKKIQLETVVLPIGDSYLENVKTWLY
ncbi:LytR/AlgR family response regulator transcription factor [Pedobacter metabolipauper]|uniref:LytTR family two component transcriptional regulator n=1 Tax=Pedobacter metabolipauper TaxID=425513 RepID=A0A4R6SSS9_9SPHI|nr:LytTR family DNA-binding domain-containing protein [Pedobacter metabolipauper]TDQ06973.1 LytTR family two component transcriptional regulator [Pedobacter metabolipauper]